MSLHFSTGSIDHEGVEIHGALTELDNAVIALIWLVGERLASRYGKLVLVSSNLPIGFQAGRPLLGLIDELAGERDE